MDFFEPLRRQFFLFVVTHLRNCAQSLGTWCSGITSASHAEGPGFKSQCVHISNHVIEYVAASEPSACTPLKLCANYGCMFTRFARNDPSHARAQVKPSPEHMRVCLRDARPQLHDQGDLESAPPLPFQNTHRGARTHDHKVKSLALCRLS